MATKTHNTRGKENGYSLTEMIVYIAILTIVSMALVNTAFSFVRSYRDVVALRSIDQSGMDAMERMIRDIRAASVVNTGQSVFGSSSGVLSITATDSGVSTTTVFRLQDGDAVVDVNGVYSGPLSAGQASVTSLTFNLSSSGYANLVKIDMTVESSFGSSNRSKTYHSSVVLKGQ